MSNAPENPLTWKEVALSFKSTLRLERMAHLHRRMCSLCQEKPPPSSTANGCESFAIMLRRSHSAASRSLHLLHNIEEQEEIHENNVKALRSTQPRTTGSPCSTTAEAEYARTNGIKVP